MNDEKRKIGEYTVLCSVNVGEKEVILASNEQSTNGDKFIIKVGTAPKKKFRVIEKERSCESR